MGSARYERELPPTYIDHSPKTPTKIWRRISTHITVPTLLPSPQAGPGRTKHLAHYTRTPECSPGFGGHEGSRIRNCRLDGIQKEAPEDETLPSLLWPGEECSPNNGDLSSSPVQLSPRTPHGNHKYVGSIDEIKSSSEDLPPWPESPSLGSDRYGSSVFHHVDPWTTPKKGKKGTLLASPWSASELCSYRALAKSYAPEDLFRIDSPDEVEEELDFPINGWREDIEMLSQEDFVQDLNESDLSDQLPIHSSDGVTSSSSVTPTRPIQLNLSLPISSEGGIVKAFQGLKFQHDSGSTRGASLMLHSPKRYVTLPLGEAKDRELREEQECLQIFSTFSQYFRDTVVVHAVHTTNLASQDKDIRNQSYKSLKLEMEKAFRIGIKTVIFHLGSTHLETQIEQERAIDRMYPLLQNILAEVPEVNLAIETMTCRCVGETSASLDNITELIDKVEFPGRLKVCIDLCHVHLSSFDLNSVDERAIFFASLEKIGEDGIAACHVSDSYHDHGDKRDAHANLGFGTINLDSFREVLHHPYFADIPIILETPKYFPKCRNRGNGLNRKISALEEKRWAIELKLLDQITSMPEDEWLKSRLKVERTYKRQKKKVENSINRILNAAGDTVLDELYRKDRKRINKLIQMAARHRSQSRPLDGERELVSTPRRSKMKIERHIGPSTDRRTRSSTIRKRRQKGNSNYQYLPRSQKALANVVNVVGEFSPVFYL